jgi:hypothetical protein
VTELERVREIAEARVKMFDANDGSFGSDESKALFQEYQELRNKYGRESDEGQRFKSVYDEVWES